MLMSASAMFPVSGSKKTRVRPVVVSELKASFSGVLAIVSRLIPSPASAGLIEVAEDQVTTKVILDMLAHRERARRAAPTTSLSGLILAPGESKEVESETWMVFLGQRILRTVCAVGSSSNESRIPSRSREPREKNIATLMMMATGYRIKELPGRGQDCKALTLALGETSGRNGITVWVGFLRSFQRKKRKAAKFFMAVFAADCLCAKKRVWSLIYRYMGRGISRTADGDYAPLELYLYGHVSGARQ